MSWLTRHAKVLLAVYAVLLAVALFSPTSGRQSGAVVWLGQVLGAVGVPARLVSFHRLEVLMNAAIVAPLTFLAALVWPRFGWRDWTALGFVAAVGVEMVQGLVLPGRQAAFSDVVANTAGALAGALLLTLIRPMLRTVRSR